MKLSDERIGHRIRPGEPGDEAFLWEMLYEAASWRPESPKRARTEVFSDPGVSRYLEGWGRPGDASVVALNPSDGAKIGAAWYRLMGPEEPGYGFVDAATPEVSIAVTADARGAGVGEGLLRALMQTAGSEGYEALSLAVEADNPAISLYERTGFSKRHRSEGAWTMKAGLPASGSDSQPVLALSVLRERLSVCRLDARTEVPAWALVASFFSVTRTPDELSVVCPDGAVPEGVFREQGWRALELEGPFDLSMVGILASVATPLAEAGVSIFAVSTFDTDYVLVREAQLELAVDTLRRNGHTVGDFAVGER